MNIRGENAKQISISECIKRTERFFEEKTGKQKMLTFETELRRKKINRSDGKCVTACFVRDLFGSLLCLFYKKIDMADVLLYPLPPDPLQE